MITLTENAKDYLATATKKNGKRYAYLGVLGGGCSGFQYDFSYDNKISDDDMVQHNILIDKQSVELLKGSEIDYADELIGESFKITNPQTKSSCGCGVSFSL